MTASRGVLAALGLLLLLAPGGAATGSPAASAPACAPGSGPDLHGRRITAGVLERRTSLACANLSGADLSGLDLVQRDLPGAVLRGADLSGARLIQADLAGADLSGARLPGADLTQAELTDATLAGADLSRAHLGQVDARRADFRDADLGGADFTQAHLDDARLDRADLGGTTFTQAYLDGASFDHARGLPPWDVYLLVGAVGLYLLLALRAVITCLRRHTPARLPRMLAGRLVLVAGIHLFAGFVLGQIASATGPPAEATCNGVHCSLGVAAGGWAPFVGFVLIAVGAIVSAARTRPPAAAGVRTIPPQLRRFGPTPAPAVAGTPSAVVAAPPSAVVATPPSAVAPPPSVQLTPGQMLLPPEVLQLALAGQRRAAMRRYRELTGASRWEAKDALTGL